MSDAGRGVVRFTVPAVVLAAALLGVPGAPPRAAGACAPERPAACAATPTKVADAPRTFKATGTLVTVGSRYATIAHDDIPGLMAPMTMEFELASPRIARGLRAGQAVRFTLEVRGTDLRITSMGAASRDAGGKPAGR